jgi:predicted dehydrogenase
MKLNTAIIGFGVVGKRRKEFIEKNKNYNLIAISDIKFKKDFHRKKINYFKNYNDIFNSNLNINCIFITLPNYLSAKVTKFALQKKIHVFCEKPPAKNYKELLSIKQFLKKSVKLKYGFNHRYHGSIKLAKKIIDEKKLGNILNVRALYGKSKILTYEKSDWRSKKKICWRRYFNRSGHSYDRFN